MKIRIGIHIGEVFIEENQENHSRDFYGFQVDLCARIMRLAEGDQILLTRAGFDNARQVLKGEDLERIGVLDWLNHGHYLVRGVEEAVEICEVGETGSAFLRPPSDTEKAERCQSPDDDLVIGWRPSLGAEIPSAPGWIVLEKLGEGGFGEVWKAQKKADKNCHTYQTGLGRLHAIEPGSIIAFKFCFELSHGRALKREATLLKLLGKQQEKFQYTVSLIDYCLLNSPLYLALEYVSGRNLAQWINEEGASYKPLRRMQMMAPVAEAISKIHKVGIIINDIKPSNILIRYKNDGEKEFLLSDLGIGHIRNKKILEELELTRTTGFTKSGTGPTIGSSTQAGSLLYLAPELLEGGKPTIASDSYAFGVTLLQMAAGDPKTAVSQDWKSRVNTGIAKATIEKLIRGNPKKRQTDLFKVSKKLRYIRAEFYSSWAFLLLLVFFILIYWPLIRPLSQKTAATKSRQNVIALGYAVNESSFNRKYPVSNEGEKATREVARIYENLTAPPEISEGNEEDEELYIAAVNKIRNEVMSDSDDRLKIFGKAAGYYSGSMLNYEELSRYVDENRAEINRLIDLSKSVPYQNLCWTLSRERRPLVPMETRVLGTFYQMEKNMVKLRRCSQILLPASIYHSLNSGNVESAYDILTAWYYLAEGIRIQSDNLVAYMISEALASLCTNCAFALIKTFPPDVDSTMYLHNAVDPLFKEKGFIRAMELTNIQSSSVYEWQLNFYSDLPDSIFNKNKYFEEFGWTADGSETFLLPILSRKELWSALNINYNSLEFSDELLKIRTDSILAIQEQWKEIEQANEKNQFFSFFLPNYFMVGKTILEQLANHSVLRAALLMRIREIELGGNPMEMPEHLSELLNIRGASPALDYLGDSIDSQLEYIPERDSNTFLLRRSPRWLRKFSNDQKPYYSRDLKDEERQFRGQWVIQ